MRPIEEERVHVVIPTIPARRAWLHELIAQIDAQTRPVQRVTVLEDRERRGPAERWRVGEGEEVVLQLDDDVEIGPNYVQRSLEELRRHERPGASWGMLKRCSTAITWWPLSPEELVAHAPAVMLHSLAGGFCCYRAVDLHRAATTLAGPNWARGSVWAEHSAFGSNEEMFISAALFCNGAVMVRPAKDLPFMRERAPDAHARTPVWRASIAEKIEELKRYVKGWDPYHPPAKIILEEE